ncbi:MAG: DUF6922 domain-containing protein [Candidatus Dojkabacteria bacterium]
MSSSPLQNQALFWDVDLVSLDRDKHLNFIIARILESGTLEDVRWLLEAYTIEQIEQCVCTTRLISEKTAHFWKNILDIQGEIICLSDHYRKTQKTHWMK